MIRKIIVFVMYSAGALGAQYDWTNLQNRGPIQHRGGGFLSQPPVSSGYQLPRGSHVRRPTPFPPGADGMVADMPQPSLTDPHAKVDNESLIELARSLKFSEIQPCIEAHESFFAQNPDWLNVQTEHGKNTLLHYVVMAGELELFTYLVGRGARTTIANEANQTVAQLAHLKPTEDFSNVLSGHVPATGHQVQSVRSEPMPRASRSDDDHVFTLEHFTTTNDRQRQEFDEQHPQEVALMQAVLDYVNNRSANFDGITRCIEAGANYNCVLPTGISIRGRINVLAANGGRFASRFQAVKAACQAGSVQPPVGVVPPVVTHPVLTPGLPIQQGGPAGPMPPLVVKRGHSKAGLIVLGCVGTAAEIYLLVMLARWYNRNKQKRAIAAN